MTTIYDRAIASALRLLKRYGQDCTFVKPAPHDDTAEPWRDVRAGDPLRTPVKIAWFPPISRTSPMFAFIKQTEVADYTETGLMAFNGFEVEMIDTIERAGIISEIVDFTRLAPAGSPVLFTLFVKNRPMT